MSLYFTTWGAGGIVISLICHHLYTAALDQYNYSITSDQQMNHSVSNG